MIHLAHVVNPFLAPAGSEAAIAQPVTFESMRVARQQARDALKVELLAVCHADEPAAVPDGFRATAPLDRTVQDVGHFRHPRPLPLLRDVLARAAEATEADHLIYTNVDIGVQPHFYRHVAGFLERGHDAFVINRRTISAEFTRVEDLPRMYAQEGEPHEGWDCFVFPRAAAREYDLGEVCLGAVRVGRTLILNVVCHARHFHEFKDERLTFHLGNDRAWSGAEGDDFAAHNREQFFAVRRRLMARFGPFDPRGPLDHYFLFRLDERGLQRPAWWRRAWWKLTGR